MKICLNLAVILFLVACGDDMAHSLIPDEVHTNPSKKSHKHHAEAVNQCSATDVRLHVHKTNRAFAKKWKECGKEAWGNAADTTKCLKETYRNLSDGCVSCFGDFAECSRDECFWTCSMSPDGEACRTCAIDECQPKLVICSGVPAGQIPSDR